MMCHFHDISKNSCANALSMFFCFYFFSTVHLLGTVHEIRMESSAKEHVTICMPFYQRMYAVGTIRKIYRLLVSWCWYQS